MASRSKSTSRTEVYTNTDENWVQKYPIAAARWLGYVRWDDITDKHHAEPVYRRSPAPGNVPKMSVSFDVDVYIPEAEDPYISVGGFNASQPYQLFFIGEKSSLLPILDPIASRREASIFILKGEMSAAKVSEIARFISQDKRPARIFYFSDFDPEGWAMPISVGRKLQALRDAYFPHIDVELQHIAVTPKQVRDLNLPSSPMKAPPENASEATKRKFEKKKNSWMDAWGGMQQTEIDSLIIGHAEELRQIAIDACAPYYDETLSNRCYMARSEPSPPPSSCYGMDE